MPRRSATMLAATLLLIGLLCASVLFKVPFTEMSPGPTYNTLGTQDKTGTPVITITGHETYPTSGHLNMTTVQVTGANYQPSLVSALVGWMRDDVLVVPHDNVYPKGQTDQEAQQENAEQFASSEDSAKTAALKELGIPVSTEIIVSSVAAGGPSEGKLHAGDQIVAVDGTAITSQTQVAAQVTKHKPGETVVFTVVPHAKAGASPDPADRVEVPIVTGKSADSGPERAVVGITPGVDHVYPFKIDIGLQDVGGPSAGLMFALGIVDKLTPTDLTGGKFVAGTGTIDDDGAVGPIGGIQMKLIAARDKGAEYFFTPADNCSEAVKGTPSGLTLVKVENLDGAVKALDSIRGGDKAALPSCG
ncbi:MULTISPECIES: YlbL family protein [Kitasatospora]|uniref:YlbL family protein n=1 Tax=Kitasatospora TaxID=2063 RepID=UPI0004C2DCFB|nr:MULTISPECIES: PDZ domain-containing protein [unclassified Kitasatospora]WAL73762.1 PDZ domain-containing protein [Kitasatospora sp. YST-16]WNW39833.1 PDZ domain-containing protein [Streptomyces sp. Li-HN-5-13]